MLQLRTEDVGSQPERGTRVLTMRELAQIWIAFEQSRASRGLKLAAKLVILLGCRSGEALGAQWSEFNMEVYRSSYHLTEHQWLSAIPFLSWLATHIFGAVARVCLSDTVLREPLSQREQEVCLWAAEGKQVSDIAKILGIKPRTVTFHLERIAEKLGASSKN